jgi:hypothetical protein
VLQMISLSDLKMSLALRAGRLKRDWQSSSSTAKNCQGSKVSPSIDFSRIHALGIADSADLILNHASS